jgi:hypothetical protein
MNKIHFVLMITVGAGVLALTATGQEQAGQATSGQQSTAEKSTQNGRAYSGMYTFLKEGEFVQVTVEDEGRVTGFISRFGDGDSDKGAFLDQYFKKDSKLDGNKLSFSTEIVHGVSFDFKGTVERGEGKNPGDEAYFVLKGALTENKSDVNKKITSQSRDVVFKLFPQEAAPAAAERK